MSLAEIMAKKRAATATLPQVQTEQPKEEIVQHSFVSSLNEVIIPPSIIPPSIIKEETAVMQVEKPMSFAERMLLKKDRRAHV